MMGKNDLLQQMTTYLGNHLRYTMEGSALDTLEKEMDCVENYLRIQQLRFPDSIVCEMEVAQDVRSVLAPPLLIQTFAENTVKAARHPGSQKKLISSIRRGYSS